MDSKIMKRHSVRRWRGPVVGLLLGSSIVTALSIPAGAATSGTRSIASGSVASITGDTMEVQSQSQGQTTVTWSGSTTFSQAVAGSQAAVVSGDCVIVTGTPSKKSKTTLTANSVSIRPASSSGSCTSTTGGSGGRGTGGGFTRAGGGFGGGGRPGGFGGGGASRPAGGAAVSIASGKVTAVKGSTISVSGTVFNPGNASKGSKPSTKKQSLKVNTTTSTSYGLTESTSAAALALGDCVTAAGQSGATGAVTATNVSITSTGGATCSPGFGAGPVGG
jgi:hypothetical protein